VAKRDVCVSQEVKDEPVEQLTKQQAMKMILASHFYCCRKWWTKHTF